MERIAKREYFHDAEHVFDALLDILDKDYSIKNIDKSIRYVKACSGASLFSFGETFEVIVVAQGNSSTVRVSAKSRVSWNVTSGMKGKVNDLLDSIEENLN